MPRRRDAVRALGPALALLWVTLVSSPVSAQQSIFNVPATNATDEGEVFVQEQLNLRSASTCSAWVSTTCAMRSSSDR